MIPKLPYRDPESGLVPVPVRRFLLALVHSNVFISVSATCLAVTTAVLAGLPVEPTPLFIVFSVTLFVYSFNRVTDVAEDERNVPGRVRFVRRYGRPLLVIGGALYLGAIGVALLEDVPFVEAMATPLVVAVLYSVFRLKRILFVKNLLVGGAWGLIPAGMGVYHGAIRTVEVLFLVAFITTTVTVAAAIFDIKDIEGDTERGIRTAPIVFGIARTRQLGALVAALAGLVTLSVVVTGVVPTTYLVLLVYSAYAVGFSLGAREGYGPLFYGFLVDGEHVLVLGILLGYEFLLNPYGLL